MRGEMTTTDIENKTPAVTLTAKAVAKVKRLMAEEKDDNLTLRAYISGGGCSGFQYGFIIEKDIAEDDTQITQDGVTILIDPMSYQYLAGAQIDWISGLQGERFVVSNPNAATTCGCGSSFSI